MKDSFSLFLQLLISRGLQLEGQVVMEEQDLQMMVMTSQKTSPLQYLIASTMQDRVRTTVEKSQVCPLIFDLQHLKMPSAWLHL